MSFEDICVVGLGQVGLPTALYMAERAPHLIGFDIDESKVTVARGSGMQATMNWGEVPACDVYVLCVTTSWKNGHPDFSALENVAERIRTHAKKGALISVESTVLPGTCRAVFKGKLPERAGLIHVPHRYWAGDPRDHGVRQLRVIGALDEASLGLGCEFYGRDLDIPLEIVDPLEIAELSKIVENSHRFLQIAFAEEIRMICESAGFDFETLRRACNSKWNVEILEARDGIGGHCLPKDIEYLRRTAGSLSSLLSGAVEADRVYREQLKAKGARPSS
jgi:nucleotide sugar dehydrogenase